MRWVNIGLICVFLLLAAVLRVWYLDRIPTGIVEDELDYVLNAKAIYHTGGSINTARWSPWSLTTVPTEVPKAEFPYVISIPFVGPYGLSLFTARIGYAVISVLYVLTVFGVAQALFGTTVGLAAGFLAAINPWSVYYGRTAYDVPVAITAYLAALFVLVRFRGPRLLLAILPLFIGFYSYIGTKIVFLPYVAIVLFGSWFAVRKRRDTLWLTLVGIASVILFALYVIQWQKLDTHLRVNQLFTPFDTSVSTSVDLQRRLTLSSPLISLFANKPIVYLKETMIKFFGAFSPSILFTNGEGIATFSLWEHGLFYPVDAAFLFLGLFVLFTTAPMLLLLFVAIIIISTLPSVLSTVGTTYVHRSSLMYPFFTIIMGQGIASTISRFRGKLRTVIVGGMVLLYALLVANFIYLYFFRFPYYNSESFGLSQRLSSRYTVLANAHQIPVDHITESAVGYFRHYLFYADGVNRGTIPDIRKSFADGIYTRRNITFSKVCPTVADIEGGQTTYVLSDTSPCKPLFIQRPMLTIPSLSDGGTLFMIFNDRLCQQYALSPYPTGFTIEDFAVENLSEKQFCERFIIRYTQPLYLPQPEKKP